MAGFAFYIAGTLLVSLLIVLGPSQGRPEKYFGASSAGTPSSSQTSRSAEAGPHWSVWWEVATGGLGVDSVMGFVMSWALVYNLVGT